MRPRAAPRRYRAGSEFSGICSIGRATSLPANSSGKTRSPQGPIPRLPRLAARLRHLSSRGDRPPGGGAPMPPGLRPAPRPIPPSAAAVALPRTAGVSPRLVFPRSALRPRDQPLDEPGGERSPLRPCPSAGRLSPPPPWVQPWLPRLARDDHDSRTGREHRREPQGRRR